MQPQTYIQLLEIFTCMGVYNARMYNFKDNAKEVAKCADGLKEMAEDLQLLGSKTFNPSLWQKFCKELHGDKPVDIDASELQSEAWRQILQILPRIASTAALLEGKCQDSETVAHITARELKPLLNQCNELLDSERTEIRGKSFFERVMEKLGRK